MTMNRRFREYVTEQAFNLTLKKSHISALAAVAANSHEMAFQMSIFVPAIRGLERRGLIVFTNADGTKVDLGDCYKITRAGQLALELLREAGLVPSASTLARGNPA